MTIRRYRVPMDPQQGRSVAPPLAGHVLDPSDERAFVVAEWSDDGSRPGEPIAPLHLHLDEDEAWYVLEGTLLFRVGDREIEAGAGAAVFGPRGTPHTYTNPGPGPARYVIVMQPRTWSLIQALHGNDPSRVDAGELFRAHGAELVDETATS
jgi:mannose-6-phosphate isomerase-like protein (cupin superfamily)